jgi:hypothetical protein
MKQIVVHTPLTVVGTHNRIAPILCQEAESIEWFKEDQAFLPLYNNLAPPRPSPRSRVSKLLLFLSLFPYVAGSFY